MKFIYEKIILKVMKCREIDFIKLRKTVNQ